MPAGLRRTYGAQHLHFITCSCYHRLPLLISSKARDCFLEILEQTRQRYRFVVVGYAVMPEHVHLLLTERGSESVDRHAGTQTAHGACIVAQEKTLRSRAARVV